MEGHESMWQQSNIRNFPALEYKPTRYDDGSPAPPPQRAQVDMGRLGPSMQLLAQADGFIQASTATFDPSLGRANQKERSGRAIMAMQEQSDAGNSNYLQNMADVSMMYEARVVLDLIPAIYDRPGRLIRTLDSEDDTEQVMVNQPFIVHPKTKRPVPVEVELDPMTGEPKEPYRIVAAQQIALAQAAAQAGAQAPQSLPEVKYHDLRKGIYSVAVSIGRTRQTLVQEAAEEVGQLLQAAPQLMPLVGPIYFKYREFPGADEIGEMLAKLRDKQFPFLDDKDQMSPDQAQARMQAMEQQLQMLQQQLQAAAKMIEADQVKQQAMLQKAQIDAQARVQIAEMDNQTKLAVENIKAQVDRMEAMLQRTHERDTEHFKAAHEVALETMPMPPAPLEEPLQRPETI
jgi:hypothetical protein